MPRFFPAESRLNKAGFSLVAGMDEVGRGPLAGPLVSAAVILKKNARIPGLNDSKKLSARKRLQLFSSILNNCVDYSVTLVPHTLVDKVNVVGALRIANDICIKTLSIKPDFVLVDGRDKQIFNVPYQSVIKGDQRIRSIAAASILAKVVRDKIMENYCKQFKNYGFAQHKGYGTRLHRANIQKFGPCQIHRKSYILGVLTSANENCNRG